jgi:hypothetical protein
MVFTALLGGTTIMGLKHPDSKTARIPAAKKPIDFAFFRRSLYGLIPRGLPMYHIVCPAKYRRAVIIEEVDKKLKEICLGIEAGTERDHVHILVQSVPTYSPGQIVRAIKSITA